MKKIINTIVMTSTGFLGTAFATTQADYHLNCRVNASEASLSLESEDSVVSLRGDIQVDLIDRFERTIQSKTFDVDVTNPPTHITRLSRFDVPWETSHCRASILRGKLTVNGYTEYIEPKTPVIVEHRHYHVQPAPVITHELHHYTSNQWGAHHRGPTRTVVIERERRPRVRRVEKTITSREERRPVRSETKVQIELPIIKAQL
jgi:hypothetical protein